MGFMRAHHKNFFKIFALRHLVQYSMKMSNFIYPFASQKINIERGISTIVKLKSYEERFDFIKIYSLRIVTYVT